MIWNIFCKKKNEIYRSFIAMVIYGTVICLGYTFFGIVTLEPFIVAFAAFVFIYVVCLFELTVIGKAILCSITVSFGVVKLILLEKEELIELVKGFADWFYDPVMETEHFRLYIGIVIFLAAVFCYMIGCLCQKNKFIKYFVFFIGIGIAIYLMIRQEEVPKPGIAFMFSFFMIVIVEWLESGWKKNSDSNKRILYMVCLWPVWIVFMIVMCFAPVSSKPYDWKFVRVIYENLEDAADAIAIFLGIGERDSFSVGMNGFSEDAQIGGDIEDSNKVFLQIDAISEMAANVYLTGIVSDTFDGREWSGQYEEESRDRRLDTLETLYAVWKYDREGKDRYIDKTNLKIEYKDFESFYYFTPNKCHFLMINGFHVNSVEGDINKSWKKRKKEGDVYITDYYQLNLDHDIFYEMIEASRYDDEEIWDKVCMNDVHEKIDFSVLKEYQKRQKERYAGEIQLSEKMQRWVDEVTRDCSSDLERLRAIEKAISCFTYTKHPGKIPLSVDTPSEFLDYFVFEKQEGYCTYFATAFTLLARAEGLPARYVQGFSVPIKGLKTISVTGNMAHAWPEVYFDGVGWIPFEPTPGYYSIRYTPWEIEGKGEEIEGKSEETEEVPMQEAPSIPEPTQNKQDVEEEEVEEEETGYHIDTDAVILGFLMALMLTVIILFVHIMICRYIYGKMELEERYRWETGRCLAVLSKLGIKKKEEETLSDLQRVMEEKYRLWDADAPEFICEYEYVLYGTKTVTKDMVDKVLAERREMKKRLKARMRLIEEFRDYRKK